MIVLESYPTSLLLLELSIQPLKVLTVEGPLYTRAWGSVCDHWNLESPIGGKGRVTLQEWMWVGVIWGVFHVLQLRLIRITQQNLCCIANLRRRIVKNWIENHTFSLFSNYKDHGLLALTLNIVFNAMW